MKSLVLLLHVYTSADTHIQSGPAKQSLTHFWTQIWCSSCVWFRKKDAPWYITLALPFSKGLSWYINQINLLNCIILYYTERRFYKLVHCNNINEGRPNNRNTSLNNKEIQLFIIKKGFKSLSWIIWSVFLPESPPNCICLFVCLWAALQKKQLLDFH